MIASYLFVFIYIIVIINSILSIAISNVYISYIHFALLFYNLIICCLVELQFMKTLQILLVTTCIISSYTIFILESDLLSEKRKSVIDLETNTPIYIYIYSCSVSYIVTYLLLLFQTRNFNRTKIDVLVVRKVEKQPCMICLVEETKLHETSCKHLFHKNV